MRANTHGQCTQCSHLQLPRLWNTTVGGLIFMYVKVVDSKMVPTTFLAPYFAGDSLRCLRLIRQF